ncbi:MAG: glucose-1-phosphate adenylyltransferase subunit GlgD [Clostridiales bacterium]|jgi:glucose-1-phosphate adenylyltransferase|nr:glucose-1-phosphate adenylyltransferase subunit GlgD [Clostridiales bacterium]
MITAAGIILAGGNNERLGNLTAERATSAMPVASCYRAIDFTLSNMTNSGIKKVAVITQYNSRSLRDHLSSSKWWDFGRKKGGLFIFSPFTSKDGSMWFRGTADSMYQNMAFLRRSNEKYIVIVNGNGIYKMDYSKMVDYHVEKNADITIAYTNLKNEDSSKMGMIKVDNSDLVTEFEEKPLDSSLSQVSLGIYVIERTLLIRLIEDAIERGDFDFVRDILVRHIKSHKVCGYEFDGYWNAISSIESYYNINMDFLNKEIGDSFFASYPRIYTKPKDEPPVKHNIGAVVKNCIIGNGSILNGYVENSVLFRKVYTGDNSVIRRSIIMEGSYIGNNCVIEHAILDKEVVVSDGKRVVGTPEEPFIVTKRSVI